MSLYSKQGAAAEAGARPSAHRPKNGQNWQSRITTWLYHAIRATLAIVFIWSGISKIIVPQSFAIIIDAYGLLPEYLVYPAALGLSSLELVAGLGLLLDVRWSLEVISGLLLLFLFVLSYGLWLGLDVDCGCFSPDDPEGKAYHGLRPALYRDLMMAAGIIYLYIWRYRQAWRPNRLASLVFRTG